MYFFFYFSNQNLFGSVDKIVPEVHLDRWVKYWLILDVQRLSIKSGKILLPYLD